MLIDIRKLSHVKHSSGKIIAQCPACASSGHDLNGKNHLAVKQNGHFNCVVDQSKEHRDLILSIVGVEGSGVLSYEYKEKQMPIPEVERIFPESILDGLVKDYSFYLDKGIKENLLTSLKSGVAIRGNLYGRFVFPIFNINGQIHGFTGRTLYDSKLKWKHFGSKSNWVYPAYFNNLDIKLKKSIILVESIGDMLALMSAGFNNVLVLFGVTLHPKLLSYIIACNPDLIYISTNNDEKHNVGQMAAEKISKKLSNYFNAEKLIVKLPTKKDFGLMSEEEIKEFWNA